jgi:hypothetical protein
MKSSKLLLYTLVFFMLMSGLMACNAEKEATERRNLMMPKQSEMARNSRYKEVEKRKTNKIKLNKSKKKSLF